MPLGALATSSRCSASVMAAILVVNSVTCSRTFATRWLSVAFAVSASRRRDATPTVELNRCARGCDYLGSSPQRGGLCALLRALRPQPGLLFGRRGAAQ